MGKCSSSIIPVGCTIFKCVRIFIRRKKDLETASTEVSAVVVFGCYRLSMTDRGLSKLGAGLGNLINTGLTHRR